MRVFETGSILLHLAREHDAPHALQFDDDDKQSQADMISWIFFQRTSPPHLGL